MEADWLQVGMGFIIYLPPSTLLVTRTVQIPGHHGNATAIPLLAPILLVVFNFRMKKFNRL